MIERGYFGRALKIVADDPVHYILGGLLLHLFAFAAFGLLIGPAICGIVWITLKHLRGEPVVFADLFRGFDHFSNNLVGGVVFSLMLFLGLLLGVAPGIVLGAMFCFVFPFLVDRELPLPEAMEASRKLPGAEDMLDRSIFFLVTLLVAVSGIVLFFAGLMFTWPLMWAVVAVAYEDLTRAQRPA
ncbi:MAG: hypothetical protein ACE5HU_03395 [Acidobacteriota bacterium]